MTAALEGGEWLAARPGRTLPPGMTRYPFYRRLGVPQGRSGQAKNLVPTGIRSRTVQSVVSPYTDWATRPTDTRCSIIQFDFLMMSTTVLETCRGILFLSFRRVLNVNYSFWIIPRRLSSNCRRFKTHYRFHLHRQVNSSAYEDGTESEFRNVGN